MSAVIIKELYRVKYRIEGLASATNASATVLLYSASESEAIYELKKRGTYWKRQDGIHSGHTEGVGLTASCRAWKNEVCCYTRDKNGSLTMKNGAPKTFLF